MAWRSSGVTNDEMVDNLKRFGVIRSQAVEDGFRSVDRKFFVPQSKLNLAHRDQPIREGGLHISAPHIYGSVLEALDVHPGSSVSFLNIGSGTGYLSCLVASILGHTSSVFGVELSAEAVAHSQQATTNWKHSLIDNRAECVAHLEYIHGNGLEIDTTKGEAVLGFDRIYVGAAVERRDLPKLADMLKPGGILVGPVGDELVRVLRVAKSAPQPSRSSDWPASLLPRTFRGRPPMLSEDFTTSMLSGVRFSPLLDSPSMPVRIQCRVWEPSLHRFYPESFRRTAKEIMLCSNAPLMQSPPPRPPSPQVQINVAAALPRALWMEVLSYAHRDWFDQPESEESRLRKRLVQLEASLQRAQEARQEMERRLRIVEGERDIYREMSRTWQSRVEQIVGGASISEVLEGALESMQGAQEPNEDNSDNDSDVESENENIDEMPSMMEEEEEEQTDDTATESMSISPPTVSDMVMRSQVRTVSVSSEDMI